MFETHFDRSTVIRDADELRGRFGADSLTLDPGAEVTFSGTIALGERVAFRGRCMLGNGTEVDIGSILTDAAVGAENRIRPYSLVCGVEAGDRNLLGPFCFLRDDCTIEDDCILGAHVEAARSRFSSGVKVSHRAFIGDAHVGARTIIGAGVVFCNWDGNGRQPTRVGADVVIGSGSLLIPPLTIGDGAVVAAGSTVTRDVAPNTKLIQRRG